MDQFRFHITLTGPLKNAATLMPQVAAHFETALPSPFVVDALTLLGQTRDECFHQIERFPCTG
ncbi:MAG: DUF1045 domain-containing protein [Pseudomonadota bacterium]